MVARAERTESVEDQMAEFTPLIDLLSPGLNSAFAKAKSGDPRWMARGVKTDLGLLGDPIEWQIVLNIYAAEIPHHNLRMTIATEDEIDSGSYKTRFSERIAESLAVFAKCYLRD